MKFLFLQFLRTSLLAAVVVLGAGCFAAARGADTPDNRPNILWITIEDWSPYLSCYGTRGIHTPHVDRLAAEGVRYEWAFTTSPVCSTSRSAMMTGFHQNFIRAHQHRTEEKQPLPHGIRPIPHLMAEAGYFTAVMSWKIDCNFLPDSKGELFEGTDWSQREEGQPFFARITYGGTRRIWKRDPENPVDGAEVEVPLQYPDTPFVRRDIANGYEAMQLVDREVGELLQRLEDEGLADNTVVIFIGDHGICQIRGKQFLYDEGTRIPMIVRWPGQVAPGTVNTDLVSSLDLCRTVLDIAGAESPVPLHGVNLFGPELAKREYLFAARDKMDKTRDSMRSIRTKDHKLILNLMPERAWCQYSRYKEGAYPLLAEMNILNLEGKLTPEQAAFFAASKPEIELFDLEVDPHEVHNVAADPDYAEVRGRLLEELNRWRRDVIDDQGVTDEFRGAGIFPEKPEGVNVDEWVEAHAAEYDFDRYGYPGWFPTRPLEDWKEARAKWEPWVFRSPESGMERPEITHSDKKKTKKK